MKLKALFVALAAAAVSFTSPAQTPPPAGVLIGGVAVPTAVLVGGIILTVAVVANANASTTATATATATAP